MAEADLKEHLPYGGGNGRHGVATKPGGELIRRPMVPALSSELIGADQNGTDLPATEVLLLIRARLEQHPHFRGRSSLFVVELVGETIVLSGRLPSYYLKQLLQETIKLMPGVVNIDNEVDVA